MRLIQCMHTQSDCYGKSRKSASQVGIVVHSTGANNPSLKRYTQPSTSDPKFNELLSLLGKNTYNNHWNKAGVQKAVHYFIGKLADGTVATIQNLPEDIAAWGVGRGSKGSYNYDPTAHIQFEVCEDALTNSTYFNAIYKEATELCADICRRHDWDPKVIVSHRECAVAGYGSSHSDIDHWLKKFGKTMDDFRADVDKLLNPVPVKVLEFKEGDIVNFTGNTHYSSAVSTTPKSCKPGEATVSKVYPSGTHPYHLIRTSTGKSTVYGWVDESFVEKLPEKIAEEFKVGNTVKLVPGSKWYSGKSIPNWVFKKKLYIRSIQNYNGKKLYVLSTQKILPVYTGKVFAEDMQRV